MEITKAAIDDFAEVQDYMLEAKAEGATRTYAKLKRNLLCYHQSKHRKELIINEFRQ